MLDNVTPVSFRELCPEMSGTRFSTHRLYSYPAKLIPQIPHYFFRERRKSNCRSTVLDPFCGAGTVMVEAMHSGWNSYGVEVNPVAALVAKVKTTPVRITELEDSFRMICGLYQKRKRKEYDLPSFVNLRYWFTERTIQELAKIKECLQSIRNSNVYDFFMVTFASIIKDVSRADSRIYVPVLPKKGFRRRKMDPWNLFKMRVKANINSMREFSGLIKNSRPRCQIICDDFRAADRDWQEVDLVITSPPYISAQKYVRSTRLEAYWLGYTKDYQLEINKKTIGSERITKSDYTKINRTGLEDLDILVEEVYKSDPTRAGIINKYFHDMRDIIGKIYRILDSGGTFVLVVGNNTVRGREVRTNEFISSLCEQAGFVLERIMLDRILSRGLMTKRNTTAGLIHHEWILVMRKE